MDMPFMINSVYASIWSCAYNGVKRSHIATWQHSYSYSLVIFDSVQVCSLHSPWGYMGNLALGMLYILSMPVCKIPRPIHVIFPWLTNIECIIQHDVLECFSPIITASSHGSMDQGVDKFVKHPLSKLVKFVLFEIWMLLPWDADKP